jgi:hypothetical protein
MKARRVDEKSTMFTTQLPPSPEPQPVDSAADLARCFLRLARKDSGEVDILGSGGWWAA